MIINNSAAPFCYFFKYKFILQYQEQSQPITYPASLYEDSFETSQHHLSSFLTSLPTLLLCKYTIFSITPRTQENNQCLKQLY